MKLVVSAFPAVGKSTIFDEAKARGLKPSHVFFNDFTKEYEIQVPSGDGIPVFDSDSSKFDKEFFPTNYISHIKNTLESLDDVIILVSSHKNVREMLRSQGIDYILAYPARELKEEYIQRYIKRGNAEGFIGMMKNSWNDFIDSCEEDPSPTKIVLGEGEFLGQDYLTGDLSQLAGIESMSGADVFHETLKRALGQSSEVGENKPIDFAARLQRLKERRDPLGIENEGELIMQYDGVLHFPDGSTGKMTDQVEIVRYNKEWEDYLAENPEADVSYMPIEIMGGESLGDIIHVPGGTVDMAQPGWYGEYQKTCEAVLVEKPDTLITATIIDVNAGPEVTDQQTLPTDNPEPAILNTPEGIEESTLTAEAPEGGVAAVDAAAIAEPGPEVSTEAAERNPMVDPDFVEAIEPAGPDRATIIEAKYDMQNDIEALTDVITTYNDAGDDSAGMEKFADGSELLTAASADIKERYGVEIEPTIGGMEGFLDSLKDAFGKLTKKSKEIPTKQQMAQIKKHIYEAEKAFEVYGSEQWQSEQKFINVGKVKLQVPAELENINSANDIESILKLVNKRAIDTVNKYQKNTSARVQSAVKVFNAFKGKSADTPISEVEALLPIKPEELTGAIKDSGLDDLNLTLKSIELPVLNKDAIKEVIKVVKTIIDTSVHFIKMDESLIDSSLSEDDFYNSKFWDHHLNSKPARQVWSAGYYFDSIDEFSKVGTEYDKKMVVIAKFLEQWVLSSVK